MDLYAVYRQVAKTKEPPLFITSSFDMARRRAKTYPAPTKIVMRTVNMGYGEQSAVISGQLRMITYHGQNTWIPEEAYKIEK